MKKYFDYLDHLRIFLKIFPPGIRPRTVLGLGGCFPKTWNLQGFHRAKYEFYADKLREIADKFQAGIGYDYDAALERCRKKQGKKPRNEDVGGEALAMGLLKAQQAAEAKASWTPGVPRGSRPHTYCSRWYS